MGLLALNGFLKDVALTSITLFIIIDPLGGLPVFAGLLKGMSRPEQRRTAHTAVGVSFLILMLFSTIGMKVLGLFDVGIEELMVAGGLMLLIIALNEIFGFLPARPAEQEEVGIIPMACPLIAGPGAITTVMLTMQRLEAPYSFVVVTAGICLALFAVWAILLGVNPLSRLLGRRGSLILGKLMGIVLAAIATSFIVRGILALSTKSSL